VIGLITLAVLAAWLLLARAIASGLIKSFKIDENSKVFRFLIYAVVIALPFTDEIVGRIQFQYLCNTEAKVWVTPDAGNVVAAHHQSDNTQRTGYAFPIREQSSTYLDTGTWKPFFKHTAFHTPGGWVMRSGLNLGHSSSCWPENWGAPYREFDIDAMLKRGETIERPAKSSGCPELAQGLCG